MDQRQRRTRRRKEKLLTFSPGEWLWVIGFDLVLVVCALALYPEQTLAIFAALVAFWALWWFI